MIKETNVPQYLTLNRLNTCPSYFGLIYGEGREGGGAVERVSLVYNNYKRTVADLNDRCILIQETANEKDDRERRAEGWRG